MPIKSIRNPIYPLYRKFISIQLDTKMVKSSYPRPRELEAEYKNILSFIRD